VRRTMMDALTMLSSVNHAPLSLLARDQQVYLVVLLILGVLGDGPIFRQSSANPCEPYVWPLEPSPSLSEEWSR
jgi:hypothetical protein